MSEDITTISIKFEEYMKFWFMDAESIIKKYAAQAGCEEVEFSTNDSRLTARIPFCSMDENTLEELMKKLSSHVVTDLSCRTWFDTVGEERVSCLIDNKIESFESMEDMNDYIEEITNPNNFNDFDYGKVMNNKTAIIRLQIKAKGKRANAFELFDSYLRSKSDAKHDDFCRSFDLMSSAELHDVKWCAFKWKEKEHWYQGPRNLIRGLLFVEEKDKFLYLGFDLAGLDVHEERSREQDIEHLTFVMNSVQGVSKVWIKFRPEENTTNELYIFHPGMGDEPMVLIRSLTRDSQWPR